MTTKQSDRRFSRLSNINTTEEFYNKVSNELNDLDSMVTSSVEESRISFSDTVHDIALDLLGPTRRSNKDWFGENYEDIQRLLDNNQSMTGASK